MRPGVLPLAIVAGIALAAILGPLLLPWSYDAIDWIAVRAPPLSPGHLLGTYAVGRDLLARTLAGTRVTLAVAGAAAGVALAIGTLWGMIAGWCGGRIDEAMMRIVDALYALPFMFVVILLMVVFGRSIGKLMFGLRVVTPEGTRVPAGRIVLRNILRIIDLALVLPIFFVFISPASQRIGDLAARTLVVKDDSLEAQPKDVEEPPQDIEPPAPA